MFTNDRVVAMAPIQCAGKSGTIELESQFPWASSGITPTAVIPGAFFFRGGRHGSTKNNRRQFRHERIVCKRCTRCVVGLVSSNLSSGKTHPQNGIGDRHQRRMRCQATHPARPRYPARPVSANASSSDTPPPSPPRIVGISEGEGGGARRDAPPQIRVLFREGGAPLFSR